MKIADLLENDAEHEKALQQTGYWGKRGAGCLLLSMDTKKFCFSYRSKYVLNPHTWSTWGGAIDENEDPAQAAVREAEEETETRIKPKAIHHVNTFIDPGKFRYDTYIVVVDREFDFSGNWETEGHAWVSFGEWPSPLHPGMEYCLSNPEALQKMKAIVNQL